MKNELLNKDIDLNHAGYGFWDIELDDDGFVFIDDVEALENGFIISILTRFQELKELPTYKDYGCRVHEMIKTRKTRLNEFKIKNYIQESIEAMNRVESVEDVELTPTILGYHVMIYATSINGGLIRAEMDL